MSEKDNKRMALGAIAEFMNGGAWNHSEYSDEGVRVVRVTDIKNETVDLSECKFLPKSSLARYDRHLLEPGDLVICTVGSHPTQPGSVVGRAAVMPPAARGALLNQNAVRIRAALPEVDQGWLGYLGRSKAFHDYIISCARGSANQVRMAIGLLKEMPVEVPPLPVQRRIAGILSAYDDLIENNHRRIQVLEKMARRLYREWFVELRFPGHEKSPRVPSSLGEIPQGWEAAPLLSLVDFAKGRKPAQTRPEPLPDDVKLLLIDSLHGGEAVFTSPARLVLAETSDTIMVMDGASSCEVTIGSAGAVGSTLGRFRTTRPESLSPYALHRFLEARAEDFKSKNIGAAIPHANRDYILTQCVALPPRKLASRFHAQLEPIQAMIDALKHQVQNLRRTRDLLLPRLMSGQIRLDEAAA